MGAESEEKSNEDFNSEVGGWQKKTKAQIDYERYWEHIMQWIKLPMLKCPYCKFQNVYAESIKHHIQLTHKLEEEKRK